jgi:hypothetical protein
MTTIFIKFEDEAEYLQHAEALNIEPGQTNLPDGTALDVIGTLFTPVVMDEEGETVISGGDPLPGYHVNLAGNIPAGWEAFAVEVSTPRRKFA